MKTDCCNQIYARVIRLVTLDQYRSVRSGEQGQKYNINKTVIYHTIPYLSSLLVGLRPMGRMDVCRFQKNTRLK